jgi:two-component system KDP operon response regulator KdpE
MNKGRILVIDDEPQMRKLLTVILEDHQYEIMTADTGKLGLATARSVNPDLIFLDIGLPDQSGIDVLKQLKSWYDRPVIILSVVNTENVIVEALDLGAADYLCKPFRASELLARMRVSFRSIESQKRNNNLTFGDLRLNTETLEVFLNDVSVKLTATEYKLLSFMAENEGRALTHQYILKSVWGYGHLEDTQYLRVFIGTLRKKIEADPQHPRHVITLNGIGYRFQ